MIAAIERVELVAVQVAVRVRRREIEPEVLGVRGERNIAALRNLDAVLVHHAVDGHGHLLIVHREGDSAQRVRGQRCLQREGATEDAEVPVALADDVVASVGQRLRVPDGEQIAVRPVAGLGALIKSVGVWPEAFQRGADRGVRVDRVFDFRERVIDASIGKLKKYQKPLPMTS